MNDRARAARRRRWIAQLREVRADPVGVQRKGRWIGRLWMALSVIGAVVVLLGVGTLSPWVVASAGIAMGVGASLCAVQAEATAGVPLLLEYVDWPKVEAAAATENRPG